MKNLFKNKEREFTLKPHQEKVYSRIKEAVSQGYIPKRIGLFLAPGAGKTFLAKKLVELIGCKADNVLVISPLSAVKDCVWEGVTNIHYEFVERFFGYETTFEVALDIFLRLHGIDSNNFILIVDEAHIMKNPATRSRQLIRRIMKRAKTCMFLTGTPGGRSDYENFNINTLCFSPEDSKFLGSTHNPLFYDVTSTYIGVDLLPPIERISNTSTKKRKKGADIVDIGSFRYIIKDMETWYQRRVNPDTGFCLLDRFFTTSVNLYAPYAPIEYKKFKGKTQDKALEFIRKRMFVFGVSEEEVDFDYKNYKNSNILVEKSGEPLDVYDDSSAEMLKEGQLSRLNYEYCMCKIAEVIKIIKAHPKEQVILWSSYVAEKNILARELEKYSIKIADPYNVEDFKDGKLRGIIASAHSDREAHTWINCRINIYMNPNNSSVSFSQNRFRSNRIGQDKEVQYYFLYFEEERKTLNRMFASYERNKAGLTQIS